LYFGNETILADLHIEIYFKGNIGLELQYF